MAPSRRSTSPRGMRSGELSTRCSAARGELSTAAIWRPALGSLSRFGGRGESEGGRCSDDIGYRVIGTTAVKLGCRSRLRHHASWPECRRDTLALMSRVTVLMCALIAQQRVTNRRRRLPSRRSADAGSSHPCSQSARLRLRLSRRARAPIRGRAGFGSGRLQHVRRRVHAEQRHHRVLAPGMHAPRLS